MSFAILMVLALVPSSRGFHAPTVMHPIARFVHPSVAEQLSLQTTKTTTTSLEMVFGGGNKKTKDEETFIPGKKMNVARRKKLGVNDDEEEYDLEMALDNSTDPFITKVIAGSLIVSILALLIVAIVIPATTDYGEGVCNPLLTGGRC